MKDWRDHLKKMKLDHIRQTAPAFFEASGGYTMEVKPYRDSTANGLTRAIVDFINYNGGTATRISSTGMMRKINGEMKWTQGNTRKGIADIHAVYQGRHLSIEVKIGREVMSEHQHKERERIERAEGLYFVANNMKSFINWFNQQFPGNYYQNKFCLLQYSNKKSA